MSENMFDMNDKKNLVFVEKYLITEMKYHELRKLYQEINNDILWYNRVCLICPNKINEYNEKMSKKYEYLDMKNSLEEFKNDISNKKNNIYSSLIQLYNSHFNTDFNNTYYHEKTIIKYVKLCKSQNIIIEGINYDELEYLRNVNCFTNCY